MDSTENYIKKLHPHRISFFSFYFGGVVFVIGAFFLFNFSIWMGFCAIALGIIIFLLAEILRNAETFYILEGGIERGYKLLSSSREFISYEKIQDLQVDQGIFQSMFGIGNIEFDTAGTDKVEMRFSSVKDPYSLEKIIRDNITKSISSSHP